MARITVVSPMYNEEQSIASFLEALILVLSACTTHYEIVLVDDGSTDQSFHVARTIAEQNENLRIVRLSRNYGKEIAMTAGLDRSTGDYVILMDSDLQDPPELIPALLDKISEGYDMVYAARQNRHGETWFNRASSKMFYRVASRLNGYSFPENAGDFRIFSRRGLNLLIELREHNRSLKALYSYVGYHVGSVPFDRPRRSSGRSKYNYLKRIEDGLDATISFSTRPLRLMSLASLGVSLAAFLYAISVFVQKIFFGASITPGWASLMLVMTVMFSVLFFFLALLSEYVGRTLIESKQRPLYYVREEFCSGQSNSTKAVEQV
nr:glycosyltransferase family 2 protein [Ferrimicrobium acidiphilum]